jgi:nicotinamidase-related amidase
MSLINRDHSLLIVIDVQEGFYSQSRTDVDWADFGLFVDRVAWVAGVARCLDVPVVVTEEDRARNGGTAERVTARLPESATVFEKAVFAAPDNPDIAAAIDAYGKSISVLVGMETDVCVAHSALRLKEDGKRVVAVRDALFSAQGAHANGIRRLRDAEVELISAKELFYDWVPTLAGVREFKAANTDLAHPPGFSL